jgi:DNA-directed RNA polymerase subunit H (RpoH/RPB5)
MDIINKINLSRNILQKYLIKEWDVSGILDYSNDEIERIYRSKSKNTEIDFGKASGLNMKLSHLKIPSHKLHIIYYNFPEINSPLLKVTKTCGDKMIGLYKDEIINPEDSIILIITDNISENIEKTIEDIYNKGREELLVTKLSDIIIDQNEKLGIDKLRTEHFKNIHVFNINTLTFDISNHFAVPTHECIRNKTEINNILKKTNSKISQLPIILRKDPMAKLLRMAPGDICMITRKSEKCGEYIYYRVCE